MLFLAHSFVLAWAWTAAFAAPAPEALPLETRLVLNAYAPAPATCPNTPLVRPATSLGSDEASYISARKSVANTALATWLKKQGSFSTSSQPNVAFASSGGGYRALLETAGVAQAFDIRDSNLGTSGVYQGLSYESGLSGGAWFLSSLAGNNWPTVTSLKTGLWEQAFQNSALLPANLVNDDTEYAAVTADIVAKSVAGYAPTIVDPYGRLLSYQLLYGADGGVSTRLSSLTGFSNFTSHAVPYPVIIADGIDKSYQGQCYPSINATIYEFHPYEYGSFDHGVSAMALTKYMGSSITDGKPTVANNCTIQYDNLGYIFGTSSDVFNGICAVIPAQASSSASLASNLEAIVNKTHSPVFQDLFGIYPNPFYQYNRSTLVNQQPLLTLADGGEAGQNVPFWPFIQSVRSVDVLIASDNSADTSDNFPNGTEARQTYINAQAAGLTKMPFIPPVNTFVSLGLNKRATFFGCNETGTVFIVYLPNVNYTYPSNQPTSKLQYSVPETDGMIANGVAIGTQNGAKDWPFCLACAIKNKDGTKLPSGCNSCFRKYCYYRSGTSG